MQTSKRKKRLIFRGGILLLWMGIIFGLSQQTGAGTNWTPPWWYVLERKSAHIIEYAILTWLTVRYFGLLFSRETFWRVTFLSAIFALAYGATDELHQFFIYGRGAHLSDVGVDGIGIGLMMLFFYVLARGSIMKKTS